MPIINFVHKAGTQTICTTIKPGAPIFLMTGGRLSGQEINTKCIGLDWSQPVGLDKGVSFVLFTKEEIRLLCADCKSAYKGFQIASLEELGKSGTLLYSLVRKLQALTSGVNALGASRFSMLIANQLLKASRLQVWKSGPGTALTVDIPAHG